MVIYPDNNHTTLQVQVFVSELPPFDKILELPIHRGGRGQTPMRPSPIFGNVGDPAGTKKVKKVKQERNEDNDDNDD